MKDEIIVKKYLDNNSLQSIAKEFKCSRIKIKSILENNKITIRKRSERCDIFHSENALFMYHNGISIKDIANIENVSTNCIRTFLKSKDVQLETSSNQLRIVKTNPFKEGERDTMYWIGMICSDGTIEKAGKKTKPRIALFSKDYNTLEQFKEFIGYDVKINMQKNKLYNTELYNIKFSQPEAIKTLNNYNIFSNKSLDLNPNFLLGFY